MSERAVSLELMAKNFYVEVLMIPDFYFKKSYCEDFCDKLNFILNDNVLSHEEEDILRSLFLEGKSRSSVYKSWGKSGTWLNNRINSASKFFIKLEAETNIFTFSKDWKKTYSVWKYKLLPSLAEDVLKNNFSLLEDIIPKMNEVYSLSSKLQDEEADNRVTKLMGYVFNANSQLNDLYIHTASRLYSMNKDSFDPNIVFIESCGFSSKTCEILRNNGLKSLADVVSFGKNNLLQLKGMSTNTVLDIHVTCLKYGVELR